MSIATDDNYMIGLDELAEALTEVVDGNLYEADAHMFGSAAQTMRTGVPHVLLTFPSGAVVRLDLSVIRPA